MKDIYTDITIFNNTDDISCSLISYGRTLVSFRLSGMTTLGDIYRYIKEELKDLRGWLTLNVRNISQGWTNKYCLCLR